MRILQYENHFCYINKAASAFGCPTVGSCGNKNGLCIVMRKHAMMIKSKHVYPGGVSRPALTALELLEANGITVNTNYIFPYRATFYFEVFFSN